MVATANGKILDTGPQAAVEERVDLSAAEHIDAGGKIVAPGFVDCHTHLIFGRSRSKEYALKMTRSIPEIEAMGLKTGIPASIDMTRQSSEEDLFLGALDRLGRMLRYGTTSVESKSGYGIRWEDEYKMLRVNQRLAEAQPMEVVSTFLGAHDFPPEINRDDPNQRIAYIKALTVMSVIIRPRNRKLFSVPELNMAWRPGFIPMPMPISAAAHWPQHFRQSRRTISIIRPQKRCVGWQLPVWWAWCCRRWILRWRTRILSMPARCWTPA
jgi:hypothetical protein